MNWNAVATRQENLAYINKNVDLSEKKVADFAHAMLKTAKRVMEHIKTEGLMYEEERNGKTYKTTAVVKVAAALDKTVEPQKLTVNGKTVLSYPTKLNDDGEIIYNISATIHKGNESIALFAPNKISDNGECYISSIFWSAYNAANPKGSPHAKGFTEIAESDACPELKAIAAAIEKAGFIREFNDSELFQFSLHLNKDVFLTKVTVKDEDGKPVEKKLLNANYQNTSDYGESITIFNKSSVEGDKEVLVSLFDSEKNGKSVKAINTAMTKIDGVRQPKSSPEDKSDYEFINSEVDVANFLPNLPELHQAIAEFKGFDIVLIQQEIEAAENYVENANNNSNDSGNGNNNSDDDFEPFPMIDEDDLPF